MQNKPYLFDNFYQFFRKFVFRSLNIFLYEIVSIGNIVLTTCIEMQDEFFDTFFFKLVMYPFIQRGATENYGASATLCKLHSVV